MSTVEFYAEKCKGCELCVHVCPKKIIAIDNQKVNKKGYMTPKIDDMKSCIGCGSCFIMCPESCLKVVKE